MRGIVNWYWILVMFDIINEDWIGIECAYERINQYGHCLRKARNVSLYGHYCKMYGGNSRATD